ncbi:pseudouridine synthase [Neisseria wadsworthii]|uniref:Dual-specificity RNA pseudouridine synthase RluF n=1 Tax=Neisseria wadsworthii 9715 TaxID=1030841 RepID=G4CP37_9NEIS|nr:pseudouridine synthase [Neisseria wadsworthii]EGZ48551.1 ribosomal large subunit pseudouridine synthase F [Neisseria wadsworthii 9715]QMT34678.1 rRNA pseudouridine synthase [Neisseria wadsworthii]
MNHNHQEMMRLSKRMAELGLCSRREADGYIEQGWVKVNGQTAVLGQKVSLSDRIDLDKKAHESQAGRVTILLNKPVGYVSAQAEKGYASATSLITEENRWEGDSSGIVFKKNHCRNLAPAGRLDIDSVGLLVLTQDGRIAKQLIGGQSGIEKEYLVRVKGTLSDEGLRLLNHGLSLDGEKLRPAQVSWQNQDQLRFILKQGKKRQIRRMCELVGLRVVGLKRIRMGKVKLGALPPGKWRYLDKKEKF